MRNSSPSSTVETADGRNPTTLWVAILRLVGQVVSAVPVRPCPARASPAEPTYWDEVALRGGAKLMQLVLASVGAGTVWPRWPCICASTGPTVTVTAAAGDDGATEVVSESDAPTRTNAT